MLVYMFPKRARGRKKTEQEKMNSMSFHILRDTDQEPSVVLARQVEGDLIKLDVLSPWILQDPDLGLGRHHHQGLDILLLQGVP